MSELIEVFPSEQPNSSYIRGILSTQPDMVGKSMIYNIVFIF